LSFIIIFENVGNKKKKKRRKYFQEKMSREIKCSTSRSDKSGESKPAEYGVNLAFHQLAAMQLKKDIENLVKKSSMRPQTYSDEQGDEKALVLRLWEDGKITTIKKSSNKVVEIYPSINSEMRRGHELLPPVWMPRMPQTIERKGRTIFFVWLDDLKRAVQIRKLMIQLAEMVLNSQKEKQQQNGHEKK
jgi:hypothetical protein